MRVVVFSVLNKPDPDLSSFYKLSNYLPVPLPLVVQLLYPAASISVSLKSTHQHQRAHASSITR